MSQKIITICDSCQKPIMNEDDIFQIKILSKAQLKELDEENWMPFDFCKTCSRKLVKSLSNIEKLLQNQKKESKND